MKKLFLILSLVLTFAFMIGCEDDDDPTFEIRFYNDCGFSLSGAKIGDYQQVPLDTGYTSYHDVSEGTQHYYLLKSDGTWTDMGSVTGAEGAKGTIRFYVVGTSVTSQVIDDSKSTRSDVQLVTNKDSQISVSLYEVAD